MHNELLLCRELSLQDLQCREQIFAVATLWPGFTSSFCSHISEMCKVIALPGFCWWRKTSLGQLWVCPSPQLSRGWFKYPGSSLCLLQCIQTPLPTLPTRNEEQQRTCVFGCCKFRVIRKAEWLQYKFKGSSLLPWMCQPSFPSTCSPLRAFQAQLRVQGKLKWNNVNALETPSPRWFSIYAAGSLIAERVITLSRRKYKPWLLWMCVSEMWFWSQLGRNCVSVKLSEKRSHRISIGNLSVTAAFIKFPFVILSKGGLNFASQIPKAGRALSLMLLVWFGSQELTKLLNGETGTLWDVKTRSQPLSGRQSESQLAPNASAFWLRNIQTIQWFWSH